jgi:hypothetical protein
MGGARTPQGSMSLDQLAFVGQITYQGDGEIEICGSAIVSLKRNHEPK